MPGRLRIAPPGVLELFVFMVYLALALILAGVACLAFLGFSYYRKGGLDIGGSPRRPGPDLTGAPDAEEGLEEKPAPARPRWEPTRKPPRPTPLTEKQVFKRIDTDSLAEALKIHAREEEEVPGQPEQMVVTGILYLDHGRRLPLRAGQFAEGPVGVLSEVKRIGNGTMILEGTSFLIHCDNTSFTYSAGDLDQIIFQKKGIVLVPLLAGRPVPVFITEEAERIRAFVKKHARIQTR